MQKVAQNDRMEMGVQNDRGRNGILLLVRSSARGGLRRGETKTVILSDFFHKLEKAEILNNCIELKNEIKQAKNPMNIETYCFNITINHERL